MCGLAGLHRRTSKPIAKIDRLTNELLLAIESRGTDATGFLSMLDNGMVQMQKEPIPASRFVMERGRLKRNARTVLIHTRFATVGARRDPRNAHPVAAGKVAAIHNGTIRNADMLFKKHRLARIGTVDSEIIPALVNDIGWSDKDVCTALGKLHGGAATAIVHTEHPNEVILARLRTYPLVYAMTDEVVIWASTAAAIEQAWYRTYHTHLPSKPLALNEGTVLRVNGDVRRIGTVPVYPDPSFYGGPSSHVRTPVTPVPRRQKHRGGKGMPRAYPSIFPAWWPGESGEADKILDPYVEELVDLGLPLAEAVRVVAEAAEWNPVDDYAGANEAILRMA